MIDIWASSQAIADHKPAWHVLAAATGNPVLHYDCGAVAAWSGWNPCAGPWANPTDCCSPTGRRCTN